MRLETDRTTLRLVVSRRNLLTLLDKLDHVQAGGDSFVSIADPDNTIILHAEEDEVHYDPAVREPLGHGGPGRMHPREEATLAKPVSAHDRGAVPGTLMNTDGGW